MSIYARILSESRLPTLCPGSTQGKSISNLKEESKKGRSESKLIHCVAPT